MATQVEANQGGCIGCQELPASFEYIRQSKSLKALLPWLSLKGITAGEGSDLSLATRSRLQQGWHDALLPW